MARRLRHLSGVIEPRFAQDPEAHLLGVHHDGTIDPDTLDLLMAA